MDFSIYTLMKDDFFLNQDCFNFSFALSQILILYNLTRILHIPFLWCKFLKGEKVSIQQNAISDLFRTIKDKCLNAEVISLGENKFWRTNHYQRADASKVLKFNNKLIIIHSNFGELREGIWQKVVNYRRN